MRSISKIYQLHQIGGINKFINFFGSVSYTKNHEWVQTNKSQKRVKVGITNYAQQQLGEIVHVQLPTVGKVVKKDASAMTIESVKMAADVYTPVSGKIVTVNESVTGSPGTVNQAAEKTWLFEVQYTEQPNGLLNAEDYKKLTKQQH